MGVALERGTGISVCEGEGWTVGVCISGVSLGTGVGVASGVAVEVGKPVTVGVRVAVGVKVTVGVRVGLEVGEGMGVDIPPKQDREARCEFICPKLWLENSFAEVLSEGYIM